jgi:hypothetical protein
MAGSHESRSVISRLWLSNDGRDFARSIVVVVVVVVVVVEAAVSIIQANDPPSLSR